MDQGRKMTPPFFDPMTNEGFNMKHLHTSILPTAFKTLTVLAALIGLQTLSIFIVFSI